ncbi:helix-turn-helix transcriptional regulator [Lachnospiraceae bacterium JLR.KK009]
MKDIEKTLKEIREKKGIPIRTVLGELKELGIETSEETFYAYEAGKTKTDADTFLALCKIYKIENIMETFDAGFVEPFPDPS